MRKPVERSRWRSVLVISAVAITLSSYLFITAPPPLAAPTPPTDTIPTRALFSILELENDAARALYTEEIVNRGKQAGLKFDEHWRDDAVKAGPLPALFLRETAKHLEGSGSQLGLFLGSRFPINQANRLTGNQAERFVILESTNTPQFFYEASTQRHTAMFTDRAVAEVCVKCHNEHKDSPKTDWKFGAIMGATTWMYPEEQVTRTRALELVGTLRASVRAAYTAYLAEVGTFVDKPEVGNRWPKDGFYLPSADVFMTELERRASATTLHGLIDPDSAERAATAEPPRVEVSSRPPISVPANPTLTVRSTSETRVTIESEGDRMMVARLPAGGSTSLSVQPPLVVKLTEGRGVEVEYDGNVLELPKPDSSGEVELKLGSPPGKS
ncbi:MAG: RodZ domain-containing protein [Kofleriaceae bacterium]